MASTKEIRTKIKSIRNTQKITRAMEMVAASKMRRAQERMRASQPYSDAIREVIAHLTKARPEYNNLFLQEREVKRVGFIIVSTDRGLCGGLNINAFKTTLNQMQKYQEQNIPIDLCLIGTKAESFFKRFGVNIVASTGHLGDKPTSGDLVGAAQIMLDEYAEQRIDRLYLVYNSFINTMTQKPTVECLLPSPPSEFSTNKEYSWDYLYEPDAQAIIDKLVRRYIESQIYQSVIDNIACEQAARMVAMKAASDNASDLIYKLQLVYNKARQAAITQELSEIIGGAAAV
ncbi:MAG: F0F1 ATP synthase subunit gamma [Gammaproteobacteria bacterium]